MDFAQVGRMLHGLSGFSAVLVGSLVLVSAMAACVLACVAFRAALDARDERRARHVLRERWLAEQNRIHRESVKL
jgi:hypothetical protein